MNKGTESISMLQAVMLLITTIAIVDHVIVIPLLLQVSGRDSWLSVLVSAIIYVAWIPLLYRIIQNMRQEPLHVWLKRRIGSKWAAGIIGMILLLLFNSAAMTVRDVTYWANITYLTNTPNIVIVICFAAVSFYLVFSGLRTIAVINGLLLPFVIFFGFFVALLNVPYKDSGLLFPLLEDGWSRMLKGIVHVGAGIFELFYVLLIQHRIRTQVRFVPLLITGLIMVELTMSPLTGAIMIFGPDEAARLRFTAYEEWKMITMGHFFEHVDFLSIYQWLVGAFIRVSFSLALIPELLGMEKGNRRTWLLIGLFGLILAASQLRFSDRQFMLFLRQIWLPGTFYLLLCLSAVLWAVTRIKPKKVRS